MVSADPAQGDQKIRLSFFRFEGENNEVLAIGHHLQFRVEVDPENSQDGFPDHQRGAVAVMDASPAE